MQVDWITTVAQIINFLVLVYLLKRFLYGPIVAAMSRREEHITHRLDDAERLSASAQEKISEYRQKLQEFEQQRGLLIEDAKRAGEAQRIHLMDELRGEVAAIRTRWHEEVQREKQAFLAQARQTIGEQVCLLARRALDELADTELEAQMLSILIRKLSEASAEDKAELAASAAGQGLTVQTRFPLSQDMREKVTATIHAQISPAAAVHFAEAPELLCGINIKGPGVKLEWNLASYLADIDEQLSNRLALATPYE